MSNIVKVYLLTSLFFIILGIAIRFGRASWLIGGYNTSSKAEKEKYDVEALCKYVGNVMFLFAIILLLMSTVGILNIFSINSIMVVGWSIFAIVATVAIVYMNTGNRFKQP